MQGSGIRNNFTHYNIQTSFYQFISAQKAEVCTKSLLKPLHFVQRLLTVYKLANCIVLYHSVRENTEEFVLVLDVGTRYPKSPPF